MSASVAEHRAQAPKRVGCAVVTISDSRTRDTDKSGRLMIEKLEAGGHEVRHYEIIPDEPTRIAEVLATFADDPGCDAVVFNGGTGIAGRDSTFDTLSGLIEKPLPGFGELFRMLSWDEIGAAAMLSRATAGVYRDMLLFSTPGSSNAVRLAMDKLIVPELAHLVFELKK